MIIFTIENESNNITAHATVQEAEAVPNAERFRNEAALAKLAAEWPVARLVEIYNSLPGVTPVNKFKDRATGVTRSWKAIQGLRAGLSGAAREPSAATAEGVTQTSSDATVGGAAAPADRAATDRTIDATAANVAPTLADAALEDAVAPQPPRARSARPKPSRVEMLARAARPQSFLRCSSARVV